MLGNIFGAMEAIGIGILIVNSNLNSTILSYLGWFLVITPVVLVFILFIIFNLIDIRKSRRRNDY